jgi:hypothetical protein
MQIQDIGNIYVYKENVELIERGDLDLYDSFYYFNNLTKDYFDSIDNRILKESPQRISGKININTAPIEVLMCLPRIDRPAARAIIEYRQVNSFQSIGDVIFALQRVSSFEDNTVDLIFDRISNLITVQSNCFIVNITGIYANRYNYTVTALIDRNLLGNKHSRIVYEQEIL